MPQISKCFFLRLSYFFSSFLILCRSLFSTFSHSYTPFWYFSGVDHCRHILHSSFLTSSQQNHSVLAFDTLSLIWLAECHCCRHSYYCVHYIHHESYRILIHRALHIMCHLSLCKEVELCVEYWSLSGHFNTLHLFICLWKQTSNSSWHSLSTSRGYRNFSSVSFVWHGYNYFFHCTAIEIQLCTISEKLAWNVFQHTVFVLSQKTWSLVKVSTLNKHDIFAPVAFGMDFTQLSLHLVLLYRADMCILITERQLIYWTDGIVVIAFEWFTLSHGNEYDRLVIVFFAISCTSVNLSISSVGLGWLLPCLWYWHCIYPFMVVHGSVIKMSILVLIVYVLMIAWHIRIKIFLKAIQM